MTHEDTETTAAHLEMAANRIHFDNLRGGQQADQGGENYYVTDLVEARNFQQFLERLASVSGTTGNHKVLVAGCGDGLESEVLARHGYKLTVLDYAPGMLEDTRDKLQRLGATAVFEVADVTDLDLSRLSRDFAGVTLAQVAQFIPPIKNDALLAKAISDLTSLTPEGVFFLSTTQYDNPQFERVWTPGEATEGSTRYHSRPAAAIIRLIENTGMQVVHHEHFDAGPTPPDDYKNDYFVAIRR